MGRPFLPRPNCKICGFACKGRKRQFCSRECQHVAERGISKPHALGNKWAYRGDDASVWAHYKRMQKLCPPAPCSVCGSSKLSIIHHRDHNPKNTTPDNLVRMCRGCHARHHQKKAA